jgi:hypothetical protein
MKPIFADTNDRAESGHFRLGCVGSRDDLEAAGLEVGDWMWMSDGELVLGARLAFDPIDGIVGVPRWDTLVHLDNEDENDPSSLAEEFVRLDAIDGLDPVGEARIFHLATVLERNFPESVRDWIATGRLAARRATALDRLGEPELASIERATTTEPPQTVAAEPRRILP